MARSIIDPKIFDDLKSKLEEETEIRQELGQISDEWIAPTKMKTGVTNEEDDKMPIVLAKAKLGDGNKSGGSSLRVRVLESCDPTSSDTNYQRARRARD